MGQRANVAKSHKHLKAAAVKRCTEQLRGEKAALVGFIVILYFSEILPKFCFNEVSQNVAFYSCFIVCALAFICVLTMF